MYEAPLNGFLLAVLWHIGSPDRAGCLPFTRKAGPAHRAKALRARMKKAISLASTRGLGPNDTIPRPLVVERFVGPANLTLRSGKGMLIFRDADERVRVDLSAALTHSTSRAVTCDVRG